MSDKRQPANPANQGTPFAHRKGKVATQPIAEEGHEPAPRMEPSHVANEAIHHESKGRTKGSGGGPDVPKGK